jgi:hypothetical protein
VHDFGLGPIFSSMASSVLNILCDINEGSQFETSQYPPFIETSQYPPL